MLSLKVVLISVLDAGIGKYLSPIYPNDELLPDCPPG